MSSSKVDHQIGQTIKNRRELAPFLLGATLTTVLQIILIAPMLFKELPPTSGWYLSWSHQMATRIMYKDFFVPFPPGSVFFEGVVPSFFSSSFVAQDLVHLAYWLIFSIALYSIVASYASWLTAFMVSSLALTVYQVQPGNIVSGYYETMLMFLAGSVFFLIHAFRSNSKRLYLLSGLCLGLSSTVKQTVWLLVLITFVVVSIDAIRHGIDNRSTRNRISMLLGTLAPWLLIFAWNLNKGNFLDMWKCLLGGGGKGTASFSFVPIFLQSLTALNNNFFLATILIILVLLHKEVSHSLLGTLGGIVSVVFILNASADVVFGRTGFSNGQAMVYLLQLLLLMLFYGLRKTLGEKNYDKSNDKSHSLVLSLLLLMAVFLGGRIPRYSEPAGLLGVDLYTWFKDGGIFISNSLVIFGHLGLVLTFILFALYKYDKSSELLGNLGRADLLLVGIAQLSLQIMNSFAGGPSIETWVFTIPIGLLLLESMIKLWKPELVRNFLFGVVTIWLICLVQVQREKPYEWSGITSAPLSSPRSKTDIDRLGMFRIESYSAMKLESVANELEDLDLGDTPVLYGLRNAGMATLFGTESYELRCAVLWWDVCPENLAIEDEANIRKNPPKVVLWLFETQETIDSNEAAWRLGESSAAGRIQGFIEESIANGLYSILCEYNENPVNASTVTRLLVRNG